jgi:hypothetical protein
MCAVNSVLDFVWFPVSDNFIHIYKNCFIGHNKKELCVCSKVRLGKFSCFHSRYCSNDGVLLGVYTS